MNTRRQGSLGVTLEAAYHDGYRGDDDSGGGELESGGTDDGERDWIRMARYLRVKVLVSSRYQSWKVVPPN